MKKILFNVLLLATLMLSTCNSSTTDEQKPAEEKAAEVSEVDVKKVFVTPEWTQAVIDGKMKESDNYIIVEAAYGEEKDSNYIKDGHIPGSFYVNTSSVESEPVWNLVPADQLEKAMLDLGITKDTAVIVYSEEPSGAGRVAFAYLYAGVENVKIIDGGKQAWIAANLPIEKEANTPTPASDFGAEVPVHPEYVLSMDAVNEKLKNEKDTFDLVSVRSLDEFLGKTSGYTYIDQAGEPKGAVWGKGGSDAYHDEDYTNDDGTYISMDTLQAMYEELGITFDKELSFYCGTGWRATLPFLIMYENGYTDMTIYDGGWMEWVTDPENEVQIGDPKSEDVEYTTVKELSKDKAVKE